MATAKKPAARPAAKRAPRTRKPAEPTPAQELTPEQRAAKVEAYHILKSHGLPVDPAEEAEIQGWIDQQRALVAEAAAKQAEEQEAREQAQQDAVAAANLNGPWYVRNVTFTEFNLRLDRQTEKRRVQLKARGTPGDMHPLKDEDLDDPILKRNLQLGIIEVIPAGEANLVMEKQTHNAGPRVHPALALLRNERGEAYGQGAVRVEAEFNSQGITVATLDPAQQQGHIHDKRVQVTRAQPGQQGIVTQQPPVHATSVVQSQFIPTGGAPASIQFGGMAQDAQAKVVDDLARRKNLSGPAAGLGHLNVVVDPVVRN